jgi:hypothetical protein
MNPILKSIISFLFQYPLYYFVLMGLQSITGLNIWWCVPICVIIGVSYDIGERLRRGE